VLVGWGWDGLTPSPKDSAPRDALALQRLGCAVEAASRPATGSPERPIGRV